MVIYEAIFPHIKFANNLFVLVVKSERLPLPGAQLGGWWGGRWGRGRGVQTSALLLPVPFCNAKIFLMFLSSVLKQRLEIYWRTTKISLTKMCLLHYAICVENVSIINTVSACFTNKINCKKLT